MKRILITGITGYIGSRLARRLLPEAEIYGLVRTPVNDEYVSGWKESVTLLPYDGTYASVEQAVQRSKPDLVYHLATYYTGRHGADDTPALIQSNLVFGAYLLEAMASCGCQYLIYASTVMAHYEGETYRPLNLYAATKHAFSDLMAYYADAGLMKTGTLILSDTYGPGDHRPKLLNLIRKAIQSGESLDLSTGTQDYDLVYIDDVTAAFELAGQQLLAGIWNNGVFQICSNQPLSLRETVERMLTLNGVDFSANWGKRESPQREMRSAVRIYPPLPGWSQHITIDEGLKRFWDSL